jgi:hypothetical protein
MKIPDFVQNKTLTKNYPLRFTFKGAKSTSRFFEIVKKIPIKYKNFNFVFFQFYYNFDKRKILLNIQTN